MSDSLWIPWAAGLFEGEGCIELRRGARTGVSLTLNTTDLDVLERFAAVAQCGRPRQVNAPSIVRPHWKTCWTWKTSRAEDAERLLGLWLPYFGVRRAERARAALAVLAAKEAGRWRTCYCGNHFRADHVNQSYCDAECRTAWQKARAA